MDNLESEKLNELIRFIREEVGEFKLNISRDTSIEDDLGVTGDEAIELLQKLSRKFNFDLNNFKFSEYFYPEPPIKAGYVVKSLTVGNIERAIELGRLDEHTISLK